MARYLVRLANDAGHSPRDTPRLATQIRELLGSKDSIGHLRVSSRAIEFDLFARDRKELETRTTLLKKKVARLITLKTLDVPPIARERLEVLREGVQLFNEERFWECHEVLEQIWRPAKGAERSIIQGLILTAAALVHCQKGEDDVCLSMLNKARERLSSQQAYEGIDLKRVRQNIEWIMKSRRPGPFVMSHNASTRIDPFPKARI